jgi:cobalt-precorrin 5A hydrolase/precorrin-3B C17-methyltransferase
VNIAIVLFTAEGLPLARSLQATLGGGRIHGFAKRVADADETFTDATHHLRTLFQDNTTIIGICASGILVRALAPLLDDKRNEPPVVAVAEDGSVAVPLLGGHHGANAIARKIAAGTGGIAAITTAGDMRMGVAFDDAPRGWRIANPDLIKPVTAALLAGEDVALDCEAGNAGWLSDIPFAADGEWRVLITDRSKASDERTLVLHPPVLALGVGCERDIDPEELETLALSTLDGAGLASESVACIASIDLKADEPAVQALAARLGVPLIFFSAAELEAQAPRLKTPSDVVFREVGCHGVAEGAALATTGTGGELVVPKIRSKRATCAIASARSPMDPTLLAYASSGHLSVIGIGPGADNWRSPEASQALRAADTIIGYTLYLDQIADEIAGKELHHGTLGEEVKRTNLALELAAAGRRVALVSSGDAGIYALASLVFELIDQTDDARWNRISIEVVPGISALQAAASRVGAPLGHDFCAISLSDLMTPEATIVKRLEAAAHGDFVVALYNPQSIRRRRLLGAARDILAAARPSNTPVVVAKNVGRRSETVTVTTLEKFNTETVDMTTLVLIGSSRTRSLQHGGRSWTYTPRGYSDANTVTATDAAQIGSEVTNK